MDMKVCNLLHAVRLYGLDVLFLGLISRLLNGLVKKLTAAYTAVCDLIARKKEKRAAK